MIAADKDWIDVLQALLTPTIAISAVAITLFQARINYLRFKHEMFDRRYEMYLSVRRFIREVVSIGSNADRTRREYDEAKKCYLDAIDGAPFVFNWTIDDYFVEVLNRADTFLHLARKFRTAIHGPSEQAGEGVLETRGCLDWFDRQLGSIGRHSELDTRLERYLRLHQV